MRILTVNLLHGGGPRVLGLAAAILAAEPNIVVVTEFKAATPTGVALSEALAAQLPHVAWNSAIPARYGVAVFADRVLEQSDRQVVPAQDEHRWIEATLPDGLRVVGLYVPDSGGPGAPRHRKKAFWHSMLGAASEWAATKTIVTGDLNTGLHLIDEPAAVLPCAEEFRVFGNSMRDAWRHVHGLGAREYSWYSRLHNGFRLDHAFVSPRLEAAIAECTYLHDFRTRKLTDHSALLLVLNDADM
jgi:exonuclease III